MFKIVFLISLYDILRIRGLISFLFLSPSSSLLFSCFFSYSPAIIHSILIVSVSMHGLLLEEVCVQDCFLDISIWHSKNSWPDLVHLFFFSLLVEWTSIWMLWLILLWLSLKSLLLACIIYLFWNPLVECVKLKQTTVGSFI